MMLVPFVVPPVLVARFATVAALLVATSGDGRRCCVGGADAFGLARSLPASLQQQRQQQHSRRSLPFLWSSTGRYETPATTTTTTTRQWPYRQQQQRCRVTTTTTATPSLSLSSRSPSALRLSSPSGGGGGGGGGAKGFGGGSSGAGEARTQKKKKKKKNDKARNSPGEEEAPAKQELRQQRDRDETEGRQEESSSPNAGQRALAEMRRRRAEAKDAELRRLRELKLADEQLAVAPAAIPERVAVRMGRRMLPFVGAPLFLALGSFVGFWYFATYRNVEFQPSLVAGVTTSLLVAALLGITYSLLSASWDEDREGDFLGGDEFKRNLENVRDGLGRSRENAVIREKMAGLDEKEIDAALSDLERREKNESKRRQTLEGKLQDELE